jgi:purine-cytosine permease-like protein
VIETEGVEVEQLAPPPPPSNVIREAVIEDDAVEVEPLHFEPRGGRSFSPPPLVEPLAPPPVLPSDVTGLPSESIPIVTPGIADAAPPVPPKFDFAAPTAPAVPLPPPPTAGRPFSFDDLVAGTDEEPPLHTDAEPATEAESTPEALFIEPLPVAAGESVPMDTGSVAIINQPYEEELPDDVDETDLAIPGLIPPITSDIPGSAALVAPSGPIATVRIPDDEVVLLDGEPMRQRALAVEEAGVEPTPVEYRIGQSARLFWLWFAANSSILSLGLGAAVFAVGMSLRQSVIAIVAGVALAFIPLGLTTLAGKRSGQPTMIVSRATFGLVGNVFPAILALLVRLFWGAVLLWLLASSVGIVLVGAQLNGPLGERQLLLVALAAAFVISLLVAFAGYTLISRIQLVLSIISGLLVVGLIAMTAGYVDVPKAISTPDGSWILAITGAVLVFSFVGLVWAHSGADLARYQRESSGAASSMFWASFGTALPSFLLIGYGALLAASNDKLASGFVQSPLDTLASLLPIWYPVPLIAAAVLSLLSGVTLSIYSGGFALQSIGLRVRRPWSIVIVGLLLGGVALLLTFGVSGGINELFRDVATTLAVPTAAWVGIFAADTMMRKSHYDSDSLLTPGGVYPAVRWVNLLAFFIITAIGFALTTATVTWLSWQGYGFTLLGVPANSELAGTDLGVLVALLLGILISIIAGARSVRRQEGPRP